MAENIIWEGTTWPAGIFSPLCCNTVKWKITDKRIEYKTGCCGSTIESTDLRRVSDLTFHRSCLQLITFRGTVKIHSDDREMQLIEIKAYGAKGIYTKLRDAWLGIKNVS